MTTPTSMPPFGKQMRKQEFLFAENHIPLNHGSYGTYPKFVHAAKLGWQELAEQRPDFFMKKTYIHQLNKCREIAAKAISAETRDCVFVMNATTGVNEILRSLEWNAGDAVLCYSTVYGINRQYMSLL
jgi:hercynylcysteine S-oxide lyase